MTVNAQHSTPFSREELEQLCIDNLLTAVEERVFFKDVEGRYLMASAGWLAADGGGRELAEVLGQTDFELFDAGYAAAAQADEREVIATGRALVGKIERQTGPGRRPVWVATTRVPLRGRDGTVIGTFGTTRDVTADVELHVALAHQALHDPMTGLPNRLALMDRLSQAILGLERHPGWVGVLFVDLDGFKLANDTFGHQAGDEVLTEAGHRLQAAARRGDTVARMGGDEFVVLCADLGSRARLATLGRRLVDAVAAPFPPPLDVLALGASVGGTCTEDPGADPSALLREADLAMYAAKRAGGGRFEAFRAGVHDRALAV